MLYARRPKESDRDLVAYEVEMLAFCADTLAQGKICAEKDKYVYLEGFLLHYRNLLAFFSGKHDRRDDISVCNSEQWAGRKLRPEELKAIRDPAVKLDLCYWENISKYLAHCTMVRSRVDKSWDVELMRSRIEPIIAEYKRAFLT